MQVALCNQNFLIFTLDLNISPIPPTQIPTPLIHPLQSLPLVVLVSLILARLKSSDGTRKAVSVHDK
jgi:hypothetical protein